MHLLPHYPSCSQLPPPSCHFLFGDQVRAFGRASVSHHASHHASHGDSLKHNASIFAWCKNDLFYEIFCAFWVFQRMGWVCILPQHLGVWSRWHAQANGTTCPVVPQFSCLSLKSSAGERAQFGDPTGSPFTMWPAYTHTHTRMSPSLVSLTSMLRFSPEEFIF